MRTFLRAVLASFQSTLSTDINTKVRMYPFSLANRIDMPRHTRLPKDDCREGATSLFLRN